MHLKSVTISGFKSFQKTTFELGKGINIIVGQNGSGKSSIVDALEYALCRDHMEMTYSDLKKLKCNVRPHSKRNEYSDTYVELVFDNSDGAWSGEGATVVVRREIRTRTEVLKINRQVVKDSNKLLPAGFTHKSFIIKQGEVLQACSSSTDLLKKIEEVSGVAFLKKSMETWMTNAETIQKKENIHLDFQEYRQLVLKIDKAKEAQQSHSASKDVKDAIEYILHCRQVAKAKSDLETAIRKRDLAELQVKHRQRGTKQHIEVSQKDAQRIQHSIDELENEIADLKLHRDQKLGQRKEVLESIRQNEAEISKLAQRMDRTHTSVVMDLEAIFETYFTGRRQCLEKLKEDHSGDGLQKEAEIKALQKIITCYLEAGGNVETYLRLCATTESALYDRSKEYASHLQKWLDKASSVDEEITAQENEIRAKLGALKVHRKNWDDMKLQQKEREGQIQKLKKELEELVSAQKANAKRQHKLKNLETEAHDLLYTTFGVNMADMIVTSVKLLYSEAETGREMVNSKMIIDLLQFSSRDSVALEKAGGENLFIIMIESIEDFNQLQMRWNSDPKLFGSTRLLRFESLQEIDEFEVPEDLVSFFPLKEALTLRENIREDLLPIIQQKVAGRAILCQNVHAAKKFLEDHQELEIECITLTGNKMSASGVVAGGCLQQNGYEVYLAWTNALRNLITCSIEGDRLKEKLGIKTSEFNQLSKELTEVRRKVTMNLNLHQNTRMNLLQHEKDLYQLHETEKSVKLNFGRTWTIVEMLKLQISEFQLRAKKEFCDAGVETLIREMHGKMVAHVDASRNTENFLANVLAELKNLSKHLQNQIHSYYTDQCEEEFDEDTISQGGIEERVDCLQKENLILSAKLPEIDSILESHAKRITDANIMLSQEGRSMQLKKTELALLNAKLEDAAHITDSINQEVDKLQELASKSWNGPRKDEVVSSYQNMKERELRKKLQAAVKHLNKAPNAPSVLPDRESMANDERRMRKVGDSTKIKIGNMLLMHFHLARKATTILLSNLQKFDTEIYKLITSVFPNSDFKLVMTAKDPKENILTADVRNLREEFEYDLQDHEITGVKALFRPAEAGLEGYTETEYLSGGQKSILSLALLLAFQKLQPTPIVILDEVDAALDRQRRLVLQTMMRSLGTNKQFVCISFREELVECGDKFLKVNFGGKSSMVEEIDKDTAVSIVASRSD